MKRTESSTIISGFGLIVIPLWAALMILAISGCGGLETPVSSPTVEAEPKPVSTLGPTPTTTAEPVSTPTVPMPTTDIPPTPPAPKTEPPSGPSMQSFPLPSGSRPHDVAPALDGGVWYTAQGSGELGWLDPDTGETRHTPLGTGSRPHGVIVGPDGAPWITDGGLNAIVRVDPVTLAVEVFRLPTDRPNANLNTATFDGGGTLWFTGQNGVYGRLNPRNVRQVSLAPHLVLEPGQQVA